MWRAVSPNLFRTKRSVPDWMRSPETSPSPRSRATIRGVSPSAFCKLRLHLSIMLGVRTQRSRAKLEALSLAASRCKMDS